MPGDRELGNDPFEAVQALVRFVRALLSLVRALVSLVRTLLSLSLAFHDEFFEALQAFVPFIQTFVPFQDGVFKAIQALVSFQEGFIKAVQAFVGSVRALLGLGLTSRDEFDGLFEVHPIEYSKGPLRPGGGGKDRLPGVDGARLDTDLEVALLFATLPVPNLDAPDG